MRRRNFLLPAAALIGLLLFFCFLVRLLLLRYERGDVYPAYSTLRADPLGARAYYEALGSMNDFPIARGFTSLHRELEEKPATLFFLGLDAEDIMSFTKVQVAQLDSYVKNGGRVVITYKPEDPISRSSDEGKKASRKASGPKSSKPGDGGAKPEKSEPKPAPELESEQSATGPQTEEEKYEREEFRKAQEEELKDDPDQAKEMPAPKYERTLAALWGFGSKKHEQADEKKDENKNDKEENGSSSKPDAEKPEVLALRSAVGNLESSVPWKSALYFVRLEPDWENLYDAKAKPVLVRRAWGKGEIIVATDSYFVSNEGLRNDRRPALLSLLTGPPGHLLFDETHLGTEEDEGVMFLAKKFRLEGYLYGILGVVLLVLWRNSVPLVPPRVAGDEALLGRTVSGKDSRSGLVNLLRRNIAPADILKASFGEWKRHVTPGRRHLEGKMAEMESILLTAETRRGDGILPSYHQLREVNAPGRTKGTYATKS
jgi:hypothetical protein